MQTKFDWSDLPVLLAFGRTGTMIDAARELGVDETTAARRLKRLETALGSPLISRDGAKWRLTTSGKVALEKARAMEQAAEALASDTRSHGKDAVAGRVRITGLAYVINQIVLPAMPTLLAAHPRLTIQFQVDNRNLSLTQNETDIAVRLGATTSQLVTSYKAADLGFAIYRPRNKFQGVPRARCLWVGPDEQYANIAEAKWLEANIPAARIIMRTNSNMCNAAAVKSGLVCAVLPVLIGDNDKDMVRLEDEVCLRREIWLLHRQETDADSAVGVTALWLKRVFADRQAQLRG